VSVYSTSTAGKKAGQNGVLSSQALPQSAVQGEIRQPLVAVLLCTYNGERFLAEQLESIERQTHTNWTLTVSDDGSTDATYALLDACKSRLGEARCVIEHGPAKGFSANFLSLTCRANIQADFYAWSDQDDVWYDNKLQRAIEFLKRMPVHVPALYCGRTELIHECGAHMGYSPLFTLPPGLANALVQNIGGGNTMMFNHAAMLLLREAGGGVEIVSHDWWAYLLVSGCGGQVIYDAQPSIRYRQHDGNLVGRNSTWTARLVRMRMVFQGRFRAWNNLHLGALQHMQHRLSDDSRERCAHFSSARNKRLLPRLMELKRSGIYRQTLLGNLGLILAAFLKGI
jgi:glycosyltransferase involved in cell wall biosynthesis